VKAKIKEVRQGWQCLEWSKDGDSMIEWQHLSLELWKWPFQRASTLDDIAMWAEYVREVSSLK
jgi:hypothetical protein